MAVVRVATPVRKRRFPALRRRPVLIPFGRLALIVGGRAVELESVRYDVPELFDEPPDSTTEVRGCRAAAALLPPPPPSP